MQKWDSVERGAGGPVKTVKTWDGIYERSKGLLKLLKNSTRPILKNSISQNSKIEDSLYNMSDYTQYPFYGLFMDYVFAHETKIVY